VSKKNISFIHKELKSWYKRSGVFLFSVIVLFLLIGLLTSIQPAYRLSSSSVHHLTGQISGGSFLHLMGMENRLYKGAYPEDQEEIDITQLVFHSATSIKPDDPRSLLGRELPGFAAYDGKIIVAGEGTDYTNMPIESSPPMEVFDDEKEAVINDEETPDPPKVEEKDPVQTTGERDVVFIYHSHNRESFLPLLPPGTVADNAYHSKANITMVGDRLKSSLESNGIGANIDKTDITGKLLNSGMKYYESYEMSRPVVAQAIKQNDNLKFFFDLHRDWHSEKSFTTKEINGKSYARLFFVVGGDNPNYEKNAKLAWDLHKQLEKKYPGISRGVTEKKGQGTNGVFNQDLSSNSIVIEFGGVSSNLEELYRTADAFAEVFSDYYWQAEKVNGN